MNSIQLLGTDLLHFTEKIFALFYDSFGEGFDLGSFEDRLITELQDLGCEILKRILEVLDEYFLEHPLERENWRVLRGPEPKTILTNLGEVVYNRRYYKNAVTGAYCHIVDYVCGIAPHEHVAPGLKAKIAAKAAEMPYRKAAEDTPVTKQTVHNILKKLRIENDQVDLPAKKVVKTLYIEADEDHVALQNGKSLILPIIYVHEGWIQENSRRKLINPFYLSKVEDTEELWYQILDYIYNHYDFEKLEEIFIGGDGAGWIRKGLTIIPKTHYVLDRFHLRKYLRKASLGNNEAFKTLVELTNDCNWDTLFKVLTALKEAGETKQQKQRVKECLRYVQNNWDGIENYKKYANKLCGVSAEGHVSHILADRISSRPKGWCKVCVDKIAKLRVLLANGIDIRKYIMNKLKMNIRLEEKELVGGETNQYQRVRMQRGAKVKYEKYFNARMPSLAGINNNLDSFLLKNCML